MNYQEASDYLFSKLPMFQRVGGAAYKADLHNIQALSEALGHPHRAYPCLHVAGTNGKGSSCHYLASILQEAGYRVGLTTSPHLKSYTERIRINGQEISQEAVAAFVTAQQDLIERLQPSFFEVSIAMAFHYFAQEKVDIAVIEVGMGGRLDSTNIITPELALITNISFDHQQFLGNTLPKIAAEKAGIIKAARPVVISEYQAECFEVFVSRAQAVDAPLYLAEETYQFLSGCMEEGLQKLIFQEKNTGAAIQLSTPLLGIYQQKNLLGVLQAIALLRQKGWQISEEALQAGVQKVVHNTGLKGRWQVLQQAPLCIADVAHNVEGISTVMQQLAAWPAEKLHLVMGFMGDKDLEAMLRLLPQEAHYYFCQAQLPRALSLEALQVQLGERFPKKCFVADVNEALDTALQKAQADEVVFVGGSSFVVAEVHLL
jgi:dihydrofolate synthase/folylpolyglutamate synthase